LSQRSPFYGDNFVKTQNMRKLLSKIDYTLTFRLLLATAMCYTGYMQNDYMSGIFGLFLAIYALIAAKYKIGCGYNGCTYTPSYRSKVKVDEEVNHIDFTEIK
jgi:hypothetical protein